MHLFFVRARILVAAALLSPVAVLAAPAPTTTALTVTPNTNLVRSTAVTLQATVAANGATVKRGQVVFCNASAAHCEDFNILGTAQITPAGTATVKRRFSVGPHAIQAVFQATNQNASSASQAVTITVGGRDKSTVQSPIISADEHTFSSIVTTDGPAPVTGTVSFANVSDPTHPFASATPGIPGPAFGFVPFPQTFLLYELYGAVVADLNQDGIGDIVFSDGAIVLGSGTGAFTSAPSLGVPAYTVAALAVSDLNQDGFPDIVVSYTQTGFATSKTSIYLGNGDGTFAAKSTLTFDNFYLNGNVAIADFNGDGIPDIVLSIGRAGLSIPPAIVYLGNGDGTFTKGWSAPPTAITNVPDYNRVNVGDFNGDCRPDLLVQELLPGDYGYYTAVVFLNKGDGTFTQLASRPLQGPSQYTQATFIADFNGDGIPDVANTNFSSSYDGSAEEDIFLGIGDGTFSASPLVTSIDLTGGPSYGVQIGDFNGDGKPDVAVGDIRSGSNKPNGIHMLSGNGDGSFSESYLPLGYTFSIGSGDIYGDGLSDIILGEAYGTIISGPGLLSSRLQATATATGVNPTGTGNRYVAASFAGDDRNQPSTSGKTLLYQYPQPTATSLAAVLKGSSVTLNATVTPGAIGSVTDNGHVSYYDGNTYIGNGYVLSGSSARHGTLVVTLSSGTHSLAAVYKGNEYFKPSTSPRVNVTVP